MKCIFKCWLSCLTAKIFEIGMVISGVCMFSLCRELVFIPIYKNIDLRLIYTSKLLVLKECDCLSVCPCILTHPGLLCSHRQVGCLLHPTVQCSIIFSADTMLFYIIITFHCHIAIRGWPDGAPALILNTCSYENILTVQQKSWEDQWWFIVISGHWQHPQRSSHHRRCQLIHHFQQTEGQPCSVGHQKDQIFTSLNQPLFRQPLIATRWQKKSTEPVSWLVCVSSPPH